MGGSSSITHHDIVHLINEKNERKQTKLSKKIFKALDRDGNGSLNKDEVMTLVVEFFKTDPKAGYLLHNCKRQGGSES